MPLDVVERLEKEVDPDVEKEVGGERESDPEVVGETEIEDELEAAVKLAGSKWPQSAFSVAAQAA